MAQTTEPGAPSSNGKTLFLAFTYIWREDFAKTSEVPGALPLSNVNPARSGQHG